MTSWPAPAKLNLMLHITGQRDDGYHQLQTAFQFLDYSDQLSFEINNTGNIQLLTPLDAVANKDNLIVRAAELLQQYTCNSQGVAITLNKTLPIGGGLGGGSSNAATTLIALNHLWRCKLSTQELKQLGLKLGADIPVFIHGHSSWAEGVGEQLTDILPVEPWYIVLIPPCHVSTAEVFSSQELTRDCEPITISRFLSGEGKNVCEDVVAKHYPAISDALSWLKQFANARMTGTGACVFAPFDSQAQAQQVLDNSPENWQGFVAKGCNISPLAAKAGMTSA